MLVGRIGALLAMGCAVGCGDNDNAGGVDVDGGDSMDAGLDAPGDAAEPESLAAMCGAEPQTLDEWEACYLERQCEVRVRCVEHNLFTDVQECIDLADAVSGGRLGFEAFERARSIAAGRASLDVETFTECLRELDPGQCATAVRPTTCPQRFAGTIADDEACYSDIECQSPGARCEPQDCGDSCCLGTCQPRPKLGEPCTEFFECEPGLMCSILDSSTCVAGDIGTPCEGRYDCDLEGWCGPDGICQPDHGEGETCTSLLQCGGETSCVGLMRNVNPARCLRVTQPGDACDSFCLGNLYCDLSNPEGLGVCRSLPAHDEPCGALLPCTGRNERCDESGTCVTRSDVGQPCSDGTCLPGLFCSDQLGEADPVCRSRLSDGASDCNQPAQCQSYICDGDENAPGSCQPSQPSCP